MRGSVRSTKNWRRMRSIERRKNKIKRPKKKRRAREMRSANSRSDPSVRKEKRTDDERTSLVSGEKERNTPWPSSRIEHIVWNCSCTHEVCSLTLNTVIPLRSCFALKNSGEASNVYRKTNQFSQRQRKKQTQFMLNVLLVNKIHTIEAQWKISSCFCFRFNFGLCTEILSRRPNDNAEDGERK